MEQRRKICILSENLYLCAAAFYLIFLTIQITTFTFKLHFPPNTEKLLLDGLTLTGGIRLLIFLLFAPVPKKVFKRALVPALLLAAVWMLVYRNDRYPFLRFLAVMTAVSVGISYRKFLKVFTAAVGLTVLTAVFCALGDAITNYVYIERFRLRSCWGIGYMTDFASCLVFLCIAAWIAWKDAPDWFFLIPGTVTLLIASFIAVSNTSVICSILFLFFVLLHMLLGHERFRRLRKPAAFAACAAFPVCGAGMVLLTVLYRQGNAFADRFNEWSHSRLSFALNAYEQWGLKFFGSPLTQIGGGSSLVRPDNYNFVDCSYLLILLRYGIVIFLILAVLWVLMTRSAALSGDRRLMLGLALIAIHSVSEHHFTEVNYNLFLVLPFSILVPGLTVLRETEAKDEKVKSRHGTFILTVALLALCLLMMPKILSCFRTLCSLTGMAMGSYRRQFALFAAVFSGFAFLVLIFRSFFRIFAGLFEQKKAVRRDILSLAAGLLLGAAGIAGMMFLFGRGMTVRRTEIDADRPAIEAILSTADCDLYVSGVPELYKREFPKIKSSFYAREDLSRLQNIAVITDSGFESRALIQRGFLYAMISDKHAVYTNSENAATALKAAGFHLTGYYSKTLSADLSDLASRNELTTLKDASRVITSERPLLHGPGLTLFASEYTVSFELSAEGAGGNVDLAGIDPQTPVCTVRVSSGYGKNILKEQTLPLSAFETGAPLTVSLSVTIPDADGVEFPVLALREDVVLILRGIHWQKTPAFDTHAVYDRAGHRIQEAYYDRDGNPITISAGYHARSLGYDKNGNLYIERFFDVEKKAILNANGFAEIHYFYDYKRYLIHFDYFDTEGNPILGCHGFSAVDYKRDKLGRIIIWRYYGMDGKPILTDEGYAEYHQFYNAQGQVIRGEAYGLDGQLIMRKGGYAVVERVYGKNGELLEEIFYDTEMNRIK